MSEDLITYGPYILGVSVIIIDGLIAWIKKEGEVSDDYIPILRHLKTFLQKIRKKK